jgi:hypothetical protein
MSLFETLKKAIFYNPLAPAPSRAPTPTPTQRPTAPAATGPVATPASTVSVPLQPTTTAAPSPAPVQPPAVVDVEAVLEALNAKSAQKLNWRTSIVDLMKLVGVDSSFQHRKELASELGYSGDTNDSAAMNMWLHKAVMRKLAENGGKVPTALQ